MLALIPAILALAVPAGRAVSSRQSGYTPLPGMTKLVSECRDPVAASFDPFGKKLAVMDGKGSLMLVQPSDGSVQKSTPAHSGGKAVLAYSPIGDQIATWGSDAKLKLWSSQDLSPIRTLAEGAGKPSVLSFSGDGRRIVTGSQDGDVRAYEVASGKCIFTARAHKGVVELALFEPDGQSVRTIGFDKFMRLWRLNDNSKPHWEMLLPRPHEIGTRMYPEFDYIRSAASSPDGSVILLGCEWFGVSEFEFQLLYDRSGRRLTRIESGNFEGMSKAVNVSLDMRLVSSQGYRGIGRVLDLEAREPIDEVKDNGTINSIASTLSDGTYSFAFCGKSLEIRAYRSDAQMPTDSMLQDRDLSVRFLTPVEPSPVVDQPDLRLDILVTGVADLPDYSVSVGSSRPAKVPITSGGRDLELVPIADESKRIAPAVADTPLPNTLRISQQVRLHPGTNRVVVDLVDENRHVRAVKTVCYVPEGPLNISNIYRKSHALLIGLNKYKKVRGLERAVSDVEALKDLLVRNFDFRPEDVVTLEDEQATKEEIQKKLDDLTNPDKVDTNDRVLICFSGHGHGVPNPEDGTQVGYLIPYDADVDFNHLDAFGSFNKTCVPMSLLKTYALQIPAKHVLMLVDSCFSGLATASGKELSAFTMHSGSIGPPDYVHEAYFDSRVIMTASSTDQLSKEGDTHGFFTQAVLDVLGSQDSFSRQDGCLTASDLFKLITPKVAQLNPSQSPKFARFSKGAGEVLFFHRATNRTVH